MQTGVKAAGLAVLVLSLPGHSLATLLYASSYAGSLTTLNLTLSTDNATQSTLKSLSSTDGCAGSPAWLTLDSTTGVLYCADEGLTTTRGSVSSYETSPDGILVQLDRVNTIQGPVSAAVYGRNGTGLAVAHYVSSTVNGFTIADPAALELVQTDTFTMPQAGPVRQRQDRPHPHQTIIDPTGQFLLVPDLGADLVRVFKLNDGDLKWTVAAPLVVAAGSGPRHGAFLVTNGKTILYLISELSNTITAYEVKYGDTSLEFTELFVIGTHGEGKTLPRGAAAAEIQLSPDSRFLTISSRFENTFSIPNFDPSSDVEIKSDVLVTFAVAQDGSGKLTPIQEFPAGGSLPRQFTMNKAGDLLAVGLQADSRVVVIRRDVETGKLTDFVASATVGGAVTCVIFDE